MWPCTEIGRNRSRKYGSHIVGRTVRTDRTVANSKLDSVMCDDGKGIDVVSCGGRNVVRRGAERILKYKDCTVDVVS